MIFLLLGIVILVVGIYFHLQARKDKDKDGTVGTMFVIMAGVILILIYGMLYSMLATH